MASVFGLVCPCGLGQRMPCVALWRSLVIETLLGDVGQIDTYPFHRLGHIADLSVQLLDRTEDVGALNLDLYHHSLRFMV